MPLPRSTRAFLSPLTIVFVFVSPVLTGCTDAAEEDYKRCEQLEREGKLEEAVKACRAAQDKDARSPFGTQATKLESKLYDKIAERKKQAAKEAAENAEIAGLEAANARVVFNRKSTPPNDPDGYSERCMARNRAYENSYECVPKDPSSAKEGDPFPFKAECMMVATSRGCMPFFAENPTKLFCCTQ